jgi:hypothetical protein
MLILIIGGIPKEYEVTCRGSPGRASCYSSYHGKSPWPSVCLYIIVLSSNWMSATSESLDSDKTKCRNHVQPSISHESFNTGNSQHTHSRAFVSSAGNKASNCQRFRVTKRAAMHMRLCCCWAQCFNRLELADSHLLKQDKQSGASSSLILCTYGRIGNKQAFHSRPKVSYNTQKEIFNFSSIKNNK